MDEVVRNVDFESIHFQSLARDNPALFQWLQDEKHAVLARDNLTPLQALEKNYGAIAKPQMGWATYAGQNHVQGWRNLDAIARAGAFTFGMIDAEDLADAIVAKNEAAAQLQERIPDWAKAYREQQRLSGNLYQYGD